MKPEKARALEESILRAAQAGRVHKVSEQALIGMLENAAPGGGSGGGGGGRVGKINFDRRRNAFDEDDGSHATPIDDWEAWRAAQETWPLRDPAYEPAGA